MQQNNFPQQPASVNEIITNAAAKAMIQTGAIQKPGLFTPLGLTIASSLVGGSLVILLHTLASLGVLDVKWKPDLPIVLPAALVGGAIVGRTAIALSAVEEIKLKQRRSVQSIPEPQVPTPVPPPAWGGADESPTYEAQYQEVEEEAEEDNYEVVEEADDYHYEVEDPWAPKVEQAVR